MRVPVNKLAIREALDAAVRSLAVSPDRLQERLHAAGMVLLDDLSRADFTSEEDRALFDEIQTALTGLSPSAGRDALTSTALAMSDVMAEQVSSDILDLRDTAMGRAIHGARRAADRTPDRTRG
jgi:hypothetical protein